MLIYSTFLFTSDYLTLLLTHSQTIQYLSEMPLKFFRFILSLMYSQVSFYFPFIYHQWCFHMAPLHIHTHFVHIILSREVVVVWCGMRNNIKRDGINFLSEVPLCHFLFFDPSMTTRTTRKFHYGCFNLEEKF